MANAMQWLVGHGQGVPGPSRKRVTLTVMEGEGEVGGGIVVNEAWLITRSTAVAAVAPVAALAAVIIAASNPAAVATRNAIIDDGGVAMPMKG